MTTLETKTGTGNAGKQTTTPESAPAKAVEQPADATLITEQQVLFASAAALAPAPAPATHRSVVGEFASTVRAMFTHEAKPRERKHYPQRFTYLESSAMSREMDRL
jgi:hypothetical protein